MGKQETMMKFVTLDESSRDAIIDRALDDYAEYIYHMAEDIYDSCIKDFYYKYKPIAYDRHGDLSGKNLYSGKNFVYSNLFLDIEFDPDNLLPYYKMKKTKYGYVRGELESEEKRAYVLGSVMKGIRARKSSRTPPKARNGATFPMKWKTSYPNNFSTMYDWISSQDTIDKIFDEFCDEVMEQTKPKFYEILAYYV